MNDTFILMYIVLYVVIGALFLVLALLERRRPARPVEISRRKRWQLNFTMLATNLVFYLVGPFTAFGTALYAHEQGWGLLPALAAPLWLAVLVSIPLIDLWDYTFHRLEHRYTWLWRFHAIHHSDPEMDLSTSIRNHPVEVVLRGAFHSLLVAAVGAPPLAVLIVLSYTATTGVFIHANVRIPERWQTWLPYVIYTSSIHGLHHSIDPQQGQYNFSTTVTFWDRLFGTFRLPDERDRDLCFGVAGFQDQSELRYTALLTQAFRMDRIDSADGGTTPGGRMATGAEQGARS